VQARADLERRIAESKGVQPGSTAMSASPGAGRSAPAARPASGLPAGGDGGDL
jgi:hypothetical protein